MPITHSVPLYIQAYNEIRKIILDGRISSEEPINEVKLANHLGVSRGPIREAVRQLEKEGIITRKNNALYVYKTSKEDLINIYQVRTSLEKLAVSLLINNMTQEIEDEFESIFSRKEQFIKQDSLQEHEDISKLFSIECSNFHELILENTGNPRLYEQINHLRSLTRFYMNTKLRSENRRKQIFNEHLRIYESIKERDSSNAVLLMEEHMNEDLKYLLKNL